MERFPIRYRNHYGEEYDKFIKKVITYNSSSRTPELNKLVAIYLSDNKNNPAYSKPGMDKFMEVYLPSMKNNMRNK